MSDEMIKCPYCGEEILKVAIKCKHCGEFLNKETATLTNVDVNDKWKKRFEAVEKVSIDGIWWKYNPNFWKMSIKERYKISSELYLSDILSSLSAGAFGVLYYLCKGMWLKFLIYSVVCLILNICTAGISILTLWIIFTVIAPYDYYRLKVLGKQW